MQISVVSSDPLETCLIPLHRAGFVHRADNTELTKRYFREVPGGRRTHVHVRRAGSLSEQLPKVMPDTPRQDINSRWTAAHTGGRPVPGDNGQPDPGGPDPAGSSVEAICGQGRRVLSEAARAS